MVTIVALPIFDEYTLEYLADVMFMNPVYLAQLKYGQRPITSAFIEKACHFLKRPRADLFGSYQPPR